MNARQVWATVLHLGALLKRPCPVLSRLVGCVTNTVASEMLTKCENGCVYFSTSVPRTTTGVYGLYVRKKGSSKNVKFISSKNSL